MNGSKPHLAILGSGPTGLEAALAAAEKGYPFTLFEQAPSVAGHVTSWCHVQLFTPWAMNVSPRMLRALEGSGQVVPDTPECPSGGELRERVFRPLAELPGLRERILYGAAVRQVGRKGLLKHEEIGSPERAERPFRLLVEQGGEESVFEADVVLDCTGNSVPNTVGDGGIAAPGESTLGDAICHQIPDFGADSEEWAGKTILLVGAGHSAQTALRDLLGLEGTRVVWALRGDGGTFGLEEDDPLPQRKELARTAAEVAGNPPRNLTLHRGAVVDSFLRLGSEIEVSLRRQDGSTEEVRVDRILALTGQVGDHTIYRQLQVHECYATAGPMKLAAALMASSGSGGDCLQQTSLGPEALKNPEPGFFILGSKSYGRRNDFLMRVGWEQVDEVFQLLEDSLRSAA